MKNQSKSQTQSLFANLPSVDELLRNDRISCLIDTYGKAGVKQVLVNEINQLRHSIAATSRKPENDSPNNRDSMAEPLSRSSIAEQVITTSETALAKKFSPSIRPIFNLTGIILHTNLGRAPYPQSAIDAMVSVSTGAANVEYNLENGKRGKRDDHIAHWICEITGAEAATAVNNNAAAVLLVLNTLAEKRQVVVSRGELIEIGGSFRMPDIMQKARCKLVEVGTTNRTHDYDYRNALNKKTAALMKVHTSNFEIAGFGRSVSVAELAAIVKERAVTKEQAIATQQELLVIDDMGSGNLLDLESYGLPAERTARQSLDEGADIITFSGDKLLGGPQCGLIAGKKHLIDQINRNPLKRTMRLDKVTLAALEAVLKLYSKPESLTENLPTLALLTRAAEEIEHSAKTLAECLKQKLPESIEITVRACESQIGSGALPTKTIPSHAVVLEGRDSTQSIESIAAITRSLPEPVIGRVHKNALWFDCRALTDQPAIAASIDHWPVD